MHYLARITSLSSIRTRWNTLICSAPTKRLVLPDNGPDGLAMPPGRDSPRSMLNNMLARTLVWSALFAIGIASGQSLSGVIDIHAHSGPDSTARSIDAIDLAKLAKARGMRGLVLKNHYESTAALAYIVRKEVPGIEVFGGIDLNLTVGGINPAAVERMTMMKGGWGRVVWMPTFDAENQVRDSKENRPFVPVAKNGELLPEVKA